ncbi:hypothetical protein Moror_14164 [Moniliophthora roreri MCA 2997]|uniref:Uncharacterized protein n=1 Tax=Moniliophthora roreri (strain MCA 2997) TaxID=1381753 RepID=V2XPJ0_MONRO|nr:hypothetical protein Moror_14164 [Moniliophthora roreri MCA 2997]
MIRFADLPSDYPQELIDPKKWLPRTRYHLFSSLSIEPSPEDYHKLVILLANPNCTIHLSIRELIFGAAFQAQPVREWLDPIFELANKEWESLTSLEFSFMNLHTACYELRSLNRLTKFKKRITRLSLIQVPAFDKRQVLSLLQLIEAFPALKALKLDPLMGSMLSSDRDWDWEISHTPNQTQSRLTELDVTPTTLSCPKDFPYHWLFQRLTATGASSLTTLKFRLETLGGDSVVSSLATYLRSTVGSSLKHLTLVSVPKVLGDSKRNIIQEQRESIKCAGSFFRRTPSVLSNTSGLEDLVMLSGAVFPFLEQVNLIIHLQLDNAWFKYYTGGKTEEEIHESSVANRFRVLLPQCCARGILRLEGRKVVIHDYQSLEEPDSDYYDSGEGED